MPAAAEIIEPPTPRQVEVLAFSARGLTVDEIASEVHLSPGRVQNILDEARGRTGAKNITHLVALCIASGLIRYDEDPVITG